MFSYYELAYNRLMPLERYSIDAENDSTYLEDSDIYGAPSRQKLCVVCMQNHVWCVCSFVRRVCSFVWRVCSFVLCVCSFCGVCLHICVVCVCSF